MAARCWASVWKSEYGLSAVARLTVAWFFALTAARSDCVLLHHVGGEHVAGHAGHDQREGAEHERYAPTPPGVVIAAGRGALEPFCDERSSGVRRLTARME